jgi:hypothetical protein
MSQTFHRRLNLLSWRQSRSRPLMAGMEKLIRYCDVVKRDHTAASQIAASIEAKSKML